MAYLSKKSILSAYGQLSQLTSDPSAQGATQVTSALRYIFALDEFTKKFGRDCDTTNKEDRDFFISFVGNVVAINKEYYTANFFNAIKDNPDYGVGSNFFSVNVVKNSVVNPSTEFTFPKRGNNPLFTVKAAHLIERIDLLSNLKEYLRTSELRNAFAVWLVRFLPIKQDDIFESIINNLKARYSDELVKELHIDKQLVLKLVGESLIDNPYSLSISDFPYSNSKKNFSADLLPPHTLINKVRESFTHFVHLVNTHTNDFTGYITKFEEFVNPKLANIFPEYSNIFQIVDIDILHDIIAKLKEIDPSLEKVFTTEYSGTQYQAFRTMKYYEMYLDILANSDFRANITQNQEDRLAVAYATSSSTNKQLVRAMRTKPFLLLAGISGTGKSRIVKQMAFDSCPDNAVLRSDLTSPGNYCLIEVKPNWHDSTELLGYESKIGGAHYQLTPFVKFLAKAMLYPTVPFFVCLDEMNLAPVEQYFAEFLSVLESRIKIDGHIVSEPLIKADIFKKYNLRKALFSTEKEEKVYGQTQSTVEPEPQYGKEVEVYNFLEKYGLRIPENVIVIGTVNMDETTHQFSRKVIDRAMTIEMNLPEGEAFMDFFNNASELGYRSTPISPSLYLATETKASDVVKALSEDNAEKTDWLKREVASLLTNLNEKLDGTPFKVAYRVQNELMLYFYQLWFEDKTARWHDILNTACDQILMMKVLPRIEGDEELLGSPLEKLANFCKNFTNAERKIVEMHKRLEKSQFTSFWP
ncbi:McrB family protein [Bacteroides acidifaciens]|uniref:McrB family protein n=1 Tax=Bacteroides acidifaciens TaxID=85831 RepID=UPI00261744FF|nr:hypothetical protein [Bacteroides acidifaciens]